MAEPISDARRERYRLINLRKKAERARLRDLAIAAGIYRKRQPRLVETRAVEEAQPEDNIHSGESGRRTRQAHAAEQAHFADLARERGHWISVPVRPGRPVAPTFQQAQRHSYLGSSSSECADFA